MKVALCICIGGLVAALGIGMAAVWSHGALQSHLTGTAFLIGLPAFFIGLVSLIGLADR